MERPNLVLILALSLAVFPGAGHFVLKKPLRGALWAGAFSLPLGAALVVLATTLPKVFESMMSPTGAVEFDLKSMLYVVGFCLVSFVLYGLTAFDAFLVWRSLAPSPEPHPGLSSLES